MFFMAAKAGLGFVVMLAVLGVLQADSALNPLLLFMTVGLIPGTGLELPPEFMLLAVGAALMAITVLFLRRYYAFHEVLDTVMSEYTHQDRPDPPLTSIVPSLGRLLLAGKSALSAMHAASLELYVWFKSFGHPTIAQAIIARRGLDSVFVRFDHWATAKLDFQTKLERIGTFSRQCSRRARAYLLRMTTL